MDESARKLKLMVYSAIMAALMAVGASIALPIGPVPIVLQNLFVLLAGLLLGGRWGFISVCVYLIAGAFGLPVFAGNTGGLAKFFGPTGGYLIGFAAAAFVVGTISELGKQRLVFDLAAMVVGTIIIYACGVTWLKLVLDVSITKALAMGMYPFLLGDCLKIAVAIPIVRMLRSMITLDFRTSNAIG
ncbi:MAG: biotin transporter BioY [Desulfobulbaceae bacterium]|nr:MAG: biotin transporter BioY [Desulfobulbaceae bacterium]